ncbi:hypothetical protein [Desulfatiglans anilini]|uniref:hypothetical protein n=1 Tax=Desulfatiglans anilini TaxID=90728 RepID=UPI001427A2E4|nr:hypothetical protein [Desulfatiglans anilini]
MSLKANTTGLIPYPEKQMVTPAEDLVQQKDCFLREHLHAQRSYVVFHVFVTGPIVIEPGPFDRPLSISLLRRRSRDWRRIDRVALEPFIRFPADHVAGADDSSAHSVDPPVFRSSVG